MPDDNMGSDDNITNVTFEKAAKAQKQTLEVAKKNVYEMLKEELDMPNH